MKKQIRFLITLLWTLWIGTSLFATPVQSPYSTSDLLSSHHTISPGTPFYLALKIDPAEHWHTYWKNPGDSGLEPTLKWDLPEGFQVGDTYWPAPKRIPAGPLVNYGYDDTLYLITQILPPKTLALNHPIHIGLKAEWLICEETCVPESATFSLTLNTQPSAQHAQDYDTLIHTLNTRPTPYPGSLKFKKSPDALTLTPTQEQRRIHSMYFFPETPGVIEPSAKQTWDGTALHIPTTEKPDTVSGILEITYDTQETQYYQIANKLAAKKTPPSLLGFVMLAFIGGILLNVMPCVLPILSLKLLNLTTQKDLTSRARYTYAFSYTLGILMSMWALSSLIVLLRVSGEAVGWGFHLQSPIVVLLLIYLMVYMGLYLLEIAPLPLFLYALSGKSASLDTAKQGYLGTWFTGILTVIIATPCTAPFMAPAIGFGLTQPLPIVLLIFTALGLGIAFPFTLPLLVPRLMAWLPKPGPWMVRLKEAFAFPMFGTAVWLIWVLSLQTGPTGTAWALLGCIWLGFIAWLSKTGVRSWILWSAIVLGLALTLYTLPSPAETVDSHTQTFHPDQIQAYLNQGQSVFVDVTAAWCVTCQVNKQTVLNTQEARALFAAQNIVVLEADWTNRNETITHYLATFGASGVPLYVYYPVGKDPMVLPQILTLDRLKKYLAP